MNSSVRALVVEDDPSWQQILIEILSDHHLEVEVAGTLEEALACLKEKSHRLAIVDLSLDERDHRNRDGIQVLQAARRLDPECQVIMLTGFATVELAVAALTEYGAFTFLRKENFRRAQFREIIARALSTAPASVSSPSPSFASPAPAGKGERGKALVVDDDAGWRELLTEMLAESGLHVRACSGYGEALGKLRREKFALAIVDLSLSGTFWRASRAPGDLEGYQLLRMTQKLRLPTIVVSGAASPVDIQRAYGEYEIFACIEKQTFDRAAFYRLVEEALQKRQPQGELATLTERERQVLELLVQGMSNKEIALRLSVSTNTVKQHLKSIFEKLNVHSRAAAVAKALEEK
jgi:DNA-binding NarL/FixJ family response regulator